MIKRYLPSGLLARTMLIILIPVLLLQITASIVFFERHWSKMTERLAFAVTGEMIAAANLIEENPDDTEQLESIRTLMRQSLSMDMTFYVGRERPDYPYEKRDDGLFSNPFDTIEKDLSRQISEKTDLEFNIVNVPDKKIVYVDLYLSEGILSFEIPEGRLYSSSSYIFLLWLVGLSLLFFTIAILFMRNQIRPIYRLGVTAERLGRGVPVGKIKASGAKEVRQAAEAFVKMQERINQFVEQRTTMLAAVSHDLKTPLTRMRLQLEFLDDNDDKQALKDDIRDMEMMIEGYLSFARGDEGEEMERIPLKDIYIQIISDARRLGLEVEEGASPIEGLFIWCKPMALRRVFDNIIGNAHQFGTRMRLDFEVSEKGGDKSACLTIEDNGQGVEESQFVELIKPFYRGDSSRNLKTGGVGLGLAIAHDIIAAHGGILTFGRSDGLGGLKVTIALPL